MKKFLLFTILFFVLPTVSFAQIVINEIMYDLSGSDTDREWVEIYNKGLEAVTINSGSGSGSWRFVDSSAHILNLISGDGVLPSGGFAVIAKNASQFTSEYPSFSGMLFSSSISLVNTGASLSLRNGESVMVDSVSYSSDQGANGDGNSLQRSGSGWVAATPTPGVVNNTSSSQSSPLGEVLSANTESESSSSQSATSGVVAPSYSTSSSQLEVSAGGDRLTSPGSPISFQAQIKKNSVANSAVSFSWSFGDGNVGDGALVSHIYKYPGDYAVVLNAKAGNTFAISRFKVKVVESDISIRHSNPEEGDFIEISNNSGSEVNLFNWKIVDEGKGFIFQPDTIIFPKSKIKIDCSLLLMKGEPEQNIVLKNFLGQVVASSSHRPDRNDLDEMSVQINEIQKQAYSLVDKAISAKLVTENSPSSPNLALSFATEVEDDISTTSVENIIYEAPRNIGIFGRAWNFLLGMLQ